MSELIRFLYLAEGLSKTDKPNRQSLAAGVKRTEVVCMDCPNADEGRDSWPSRDCGGCLREFCSRAKQAAGKGEVEETEAKERSVEICSSCYIPLAS